MRTYKIANSRMIEAIAKVDRKVYVSKYFYTNFHQKLSIATLYLIIC